ncbi:MAG: HD domain-containing protein [Thermoprotei archaeon]|nr:HD domain-containing protein [Thermoprotei archaeon]
MDLKLLLEFSPRMRYLYRITRSLMGDDPSHGWPHIERVIIWSNRIVNAEGLDVDPELLLASILLHDIGRVLGDEKEHHAVKSAKIGELLLEKLEYHRSFTEDCKKVILAHSYTLNVKPETLEAKVLSDADKLDAMGAIGIARVFHTGALNARSFEDSVSHLKTKILNLRELLYFNYSRNVATSLENKIRVFMEWWAEESVF